MPTLYELLGVEKGASDDEIKKAWRRKALTEHPDKGGDKEKFQAAQDAYRVLSDERLRRIYDQTGQVPNDDGSVPGQGGPSEGPDLSHIFGQMFGSGFPFPGFPGMGGPPPPGMKVPRGPNKHHEIGLSLKDFYKGRTLNINMTRDILCGSCKGAGGSRPEKCGACGGRGMRVQHVQMGPMITMSHSPCGECGQTGQRCADTCGDCEGRRIKQKDNTIVAHIEPGMGEGDRLVFPQQCSESPQYEVPGDFVLILRYSNNENTQWVRTGDNLGVEVEVSLAEALLGFERVFNDHPSEKPVRFVWNQGLVNNGDVLRIVGAGMPVRGSDRFGDALLTVRIRREQGTLSDEQKRSLQSVWPEWKEPIITADDRAVVRI